MIFILHLILLFPRRRESRKFKF